MGIFNEWIATNVDEVGVSALDFYSIGHVCFGLGVFLFFSLFYTIPRHYDNKPIFSLRWCFIFTISILILWEILENVVFIQLGMKFENRADSILNMTTDIILGIVFGLINWLAAYEIEEHDEKGIKWYYLTGGIAFAVWFILFAVLRYITYLHTGYF